MLRARPVQRFGSKLQSLVTQPRVPRCKWARAFGITFVSTFDDAAFVADLPVPGGRAASAAALAACGDAAIDCEAADAAAAHSQPSPVWPTPRGAAAVGTAHQRHGAAQQDADAAANQHWILCGAGRRGAAVANAIVVPASRSAACYDGVHNDNVTNVHVRGL